MQRQHNTAPHLRVYGNKSHQKAAAAQISHVNIYFPDAALVILRQGPAVYTCQRRGREFGSRFVISGTAAAAGRTHFIVQVARMTSFGERESCKSGDASRQLTAGCIYL
jgi:hypothetical protein